MNTFFHPDDKEQVVKYVKSLFKGVPYEIDYRIVTKSGGTKLVHEKTSTIYDKNGELIKIIGVIKNIQENQNISEENIKEDEEKSRIQKRLQNRVQVARDGYEIINTDGKITYASPAVERIVGYTYEDLVGEKIYSFFGNSEAKLMEDMVSRVTMNPIKNVKSEILFTTKDGKEKHLEIYLTKLEDSPLGDIAVNFIDITKRKKLESEIFYQSNYDDLTGLKNRNCFLGNLGKIYKKAKKKGKKHALIMVDINGIRSINFPIGHDIEEKLIKKALKRLRIIFKDDRYICRYSEDVFAIIDSSKSTDEGYKALASEIIGLFKTPFNIDSYQFAVEINIGMCTFPGLEEDELPLKNKAKIALSRSKKAGRNNYKFYSQELNIKYYKDFVLRNDIWNAIDNEELELYYQPIVNMVSNEIIGVEALIRWNHPQWGMVSP